MTIPSHDALTIRDLAELEPGTIHTVRSDIIAGRLSGPVTTTGKPVFSLGRYLADRKARQAAEEQRFAGVLTKFRARNAARAIDALA